MTRKAENTLLLWRYPEKTGNTILIVRIIYNIHSKLQHHHIYCKTHSIASQNLGRLLPFHCCNCLTHWHTRVQSNHLRSNCKCWRHIHCRCFIVLYPLFGPRNSVSSPTTIKKDSHSPIRRLVELLKNQPHKKTMWRF